MPAAKYTGECCYLPAPLLIFANVRLIKSLRRIHQDQSEWRTMDQTNYTSFSRDDFAVLRADGSQQPFHMLNLIKLRPQATYDDGRTASGAEAYAAYGRISYPVFSRLGGSIVWRGQLDRILIGPKQEDWDICFIAQYPSPAAFVEMVLDPVYREAMRHRQAAVENSRLIRLASMPPGNAFHGVAP
jgi:uncharacterized protein (DUF1330 family)